MIPTKRPPGTAVVNAYLILRQEGAVCLLLRKNTGYCDGLYGLISGRVEDGESATEGMIREAYEEAGLQPAPSQLKVVHIMHRKTNLLGVDIFFDCCSWNGVVENREPHKCEDLAFFPLEGLPSNTVPYIVDALESIRQGCFYSEAGW